MRKKLRLLLCVLFATSAFCSAAITIHMEEVGSNVVATLSGSINSLAGATFSQTGSVNMYNSLRSLGPTPPAHIMFTTAQGLLNMNQYTITNRPVNFGSNTAFQVADSSTASTSMLFSTTATQNLSIATTYVLGTAVTGSLTWNNKTLSSMGISTGTYLWSWTGDSMTLNVVPEPSALSLLIVGLGGWVISRRMANK